MNKYEVADLYEASYGEHGKSIHALNWGSQEIANERQHVLVDGLEFIHDFQHGKKFSVLDVGCGFGDLLNVPGAATWIRSYTGIDSNPDFIRIARTRFDKLGNTTFHLGDALDILPAFDELGSLGDKRDVVIANGTLAFYDADLIYQLVSKMWSATKLYLGFNFTRNDDVGIMQIGNLLGYVGIKRYIIRTDFGRLGEFAVYAYKTDD